MIILRKITQNNNLIKTLLFIKFASFYSFLIQALGKSVYFLKKNAKPIAKIPIAATIIQVLAELDFELSTFSLLFTSSFTIGFLKSYQNYFFSIS
jgi:hypothetical protein